jgi:hypothetical protein
MTDLGKLIKYRSERKSRRSERSTGTSRTSTRSTRSTGTSRTSRKRITRKNGNTIIKPQLYTIHENDAENNSPKIVSRSKGQSNKIVPIVKPTFINRLLKFMNFKGDK